MKHLPYTFFFVSFIFIVTGQSLLAQPMSFGVDTSQSLLKWTGKKVTGSHNGTVKILSGKVEVEGSEIKAGEFEIDMNSLFVEDIKDPKYNRKLTDHLKSDDFFNSANFPKSSFKIKEAKKLATPGVNGENYEITGALTIVGVTHDVSFPANVTINDKQASASGTVKIDRTKYNIRYGSGKFFENLGDKLIYDEFEVQISLAATA